MNIKNPICEHSSTTQPSTTDFSKATFERAADVFKALGDPARLRLLMLVLPGQLCVSEIAAATDEGISTISQRLKVLRSEGLLVSRREGKHIFYGLADQHITDLILNALNHASELRIISDDNSLSNTWPGRATASPIAERSEQAATA